MSDEFEEVESLFKLPKPKKKTLADPEGSGATRRQLRLLSKLPDMMAGNKTLAQITVESGFARDIKNAATVGERELTKLKKQLSQNAMLLQALNLNGASIEDAAKTLGEMLHANTVVRVKSHKGNIEGTKVVPDNKVRNTAAQFIIEAHGALPERKIVTEHHSFESKLAIIKVIKENPEEAMKIIHEKMGMVKNDE